MKITRLNEDCSWLWEIGPYKVLVDPWFTMSQVDLHPRFSTQYHLNAQPKSNEIPRPDFIFISHPFTDHCHKETLLEFSKDIPVICLPSVQKKMKKWGHFQTFLDLGHAPFSVKKVSRTGLLDLVHHAYLISDGTSQICYAPHGTKKVLANVSAAILITTVTTYQLPFFLGGTVNLGLQGALKLAEKLGASQIISTHDEQKIQKGIVAGLSKRRFSKHEKIKFLSTGETFDC